MTFAQPTLPRRYTEATSPPSNSMTNSRRHREKANTMVASPNKRFSEAGQGMNLTITNVDSDVDAPGSTANNVRPSEQRKKLSGQKNYAEDDMRDYTPEIAIRHIKSAQREVFTKKTREDSGVRQI